MVTADSGVGEEDESSDGETERYEFSQCHEQHPVGSVEACEVSEYDDDLDGLDDDESQQDQNARNRQHVVPDEQTCPEDQEC